MPTRTRRYSCWKCQYSWIAPIEYSNITQNISGEKTSYCPKCGKRADVSYAIKETPNGKEYTKCLH
jgi:formate dehydrogenase maturation protein FdhE